MVKPIPQQIYRHFKGKLYQIISLAEHSESGEILVIYQALYGEFKIYARPLSMFLEKVDKEKYPDAVQEYRFELQKVTSETNAQQIADAPNADIPKAGAQAADEALIQEEELQKADEASVQEEELSIDPLVLEFLDANSYEERLNILTALHHRITDDMINTMAIAVDVEVKEGEIEQRYEELRRCILLYDKFECSRLR